jgi:glutamate N-acetyltransferase/amino-acid N-acetyltransferase
MYGGLRAKGDKADLALIMCETDAVVGGVFTLNVMCAAPVLYCKDILSKKDTVRAVLVSYVGFCYSFLGAARGGR